VTALPCRCLVTLLASAAALVFTIAVQAYGREPGTGPGYEIIRLLFTGRNIDAVQLAQNFAETAPVAERQSAIRLAAQTCVTAIDIDCARNVLKHANAFLSALPVSELQPQSLGYVVLLDSFVRVMSGDTYSNFFGLALPLPGINPIDDPVLFAELHLLAAKHARQMFDFETSRDNLDKALAITLSLEFERFDANRLIVRIAAQLLENYEVERAARLVFAALPLLEKTPANSLLGYEFLQVLNALVGYRKGGVDALAAGLRDQISELDKLQLPPALASSLRTATYNDLLGVEALRGDRDAVQKLLHSHPLMAAKPDILGRGYFADVNEFNFALAEEFARLVVQDQAETGWGDLPKMPPRWTNDPERIQEVQAFGQAAIGLRLLRGGKPEARQELIEAGRKRLKTLQDRYRQATYFSPLPYWTDQVLLEFVVAAALSEPIPDYELILQAHIVHARSIETSPDDALTNMAVQPSDELRRVSQSSRTLGYQQIDRERTQAVELVKRLLSSNAREFEIVAKSRRDNLLASEDFIRKQQQLHAALAGGGGEDVTSVARLANVKELLLADEALVFHVPVLGSVSKICIRRDRIWHSTHELDSATVALDARLVSAALTATHPPSIEADSQYPAAEAVRLGKVLFGGLDDCMRSSKRIYLLAPPGDLGLVPPAALLTEVPPAMGSGFDLRAAHWLVRDHAFVRVTSISAFVATKRLSRTKGAALQYLGVGDPVLARQDAPAPGQLAARESAQSKPFASLPELPETSEELERVAGQFDASKARVLLREKATEESFRLQPLSEFDVIHFATHALIREEQPGLREPSLVLTPERKGDPLSSGLLTSSQIAALPLKARLVVLSACNSARYEPTVFDGGIQGLSTSFAEAGVPTMIAALWPIESTLTRDLIVATFQAARGGDVAIADALALAVRRHLDGQAARPLMHPRFWSALVVLGNGSTTLNAPSSAPGPAIDRRR
jgi:CHAT domain-containing protein